ncbi:glycosyltransferase family 2 protein [Methyloceanibacter sp. wino2]|uniref:glycosyltransferase n=1 Tax=Methyloceanibacter sp. wino2 TaxID=2170729 RepID=UPI000D3E23D7|nr:glycosyltransferase [Methyloceanibacter sp. wino2]
MLQPIADGITYLTAQSGDSLFRLFWFVVIFEFPRYTLSFFSVAAILLYPKGKQDPFLGRVTVVIAGHNEEDSIERCVLALHEQSRVPDEIIAVSDGSADRTAMKLRNLQDAGLITEGHSTQVRAGKSAALNLALSRATGDIVVVVDCDCTFDRHAIRDILEPLADPRVGAVAGNVVVRNPERSLITAFQAVEYLISISQGKQASDLTDQVSCVSGAFGAFRRKALLGVGGYDAGGGEDLDVTLSLRKAGWKTVFASDALCYTDVPDRLSVLIRQRFRWERDAVHLRYRKHGDLMNPMSPRFSLREVWHEIDFIVFNLGSAFFFPIYIVWLFATYGELGFVILLGAQAGMLALDGMAFVLAAVATPKVDTVRLIPFVPGYSFFNGFLMRFVRLGAYLQEWIFSASYRDTYVPHKVHRVRR